MNVKVKNLFTAGFILGLGIMGAFDGILFHQLLQWHHLIDHPNASFEIFTDGIFNALVTVLLVWGGVKILHDARMNRLSGRWRVFIGSMLAGGGTFNLVEGLINHQILQVHHVKPGSPNQFLYDMLFLLSGVILIAIGLMVSQVLKGRNINLKVKRVKSKQPS